MKLYVTFLENLRLGQVIRVFSTEGQAQDFCRKFMASPGYFREGGGDDKEEGSEGYVWYRKYTEEDLDSLLIQEVILNDDSIGVGLK